MSTKYKNIREQAHGRWLDIFQYVCPGMFNEAIEHLGSHVTCPFHGGVNDFRFIKRATRQGKGNTAEVGVAMCTCGVYLSGFDVIARALGCSFKEAVNAVDEYLNGHVRTYSVKPIHIPTKEEDLARNEEILSKVNNLWLAGKQLNLNKTPYYLERGISPDTCADIQDVRTLASLGYFHKGPNDTELVKMGSYPAILGLMRSPDGAPVAIHRTWLSTDSKTKAPVPKAKKLTLTTGVRGAAIRLFNLDDSPTLGLTEGIETALAVRELAARGFWEKPQKIPVWACFAERNVRNFQIPPQLLATLRKLVVFADNDERGTGMAAALELKSRMKIEQPKLIVDIKMPTVTGWDWLDVLVNQ